MQEIATKKDFDYSIVDDTIAKFLKVKEQELQSIVLNSSIQLGEALIEAQDKLAKYGEGTFVKWFESIGLKRQSVYNYINQCKFFHQMEKVEQIEMFQELPTTLKTEISKPSAKQEAVEMVLSGDIKTTKEYKELERKLKDSEERNKRLAEQELKQEVIEKEVVIEKVPDDYNYYKSNYEAGKGVQEFYKKQNEELREEMKELEKIIKAQRANSASQSELQKLEEKKATLNSEIESLNKIAKFQEVVETFISDNASLSYTKDFENLYNNRELTLSLLDTFNRLEKWIDDTKSLLPNGNIIEGE